MNENDLKEYIGKVVTVRYRKQDEEMDSVQGEVLEVDQGVVCLGVNIYRPTPGAESILRLKESDFIKLVDLRVIEHLELISEKNTHSDGLMTVGNCTRYCASIFESIYYKSISDPTDFFASSNYYLHAMKSGFVTDDIMDQYLKTIWSYLTTIKNDKDNGDEELYGHELENRLRCLNEFSNFIASDRNIFQYLSIYKLNAVITRLFDLKRFAYAHEAAYAVFNRYPQSLLDSEKGIRKLLKEPKICGSALIFAVQTENLYCQAMAVNADRLGRKDQCSKYKKIEEGLNELMNRAKVNIDSIKKSSCASISDKDAEQLANMEKNIKAYFKHVKSVRNFSDDRSTIFQLIFNNLKKEISNTDKEKATNPKANDPSFIVGLKSRYDKAMAQLYNLYRFIGLFKKSADDEGESLWQIALELMQLYSKKLSLISDQNEKEEYRVAKRDAIKTNILDRLREVPNGVNYFKNCSHSKLVPISEYLYEFNLLDDYIAISKVIDYSSYDGIKPEDKTLCSLRVACIYSSREDVAKFKKSFDIAEDNFNRLNGSDEKAKYEECRKLYSSLRAKYTPGLLAWIEFRNQLNLLLKKVKKSDGDAELQNLCTAFKRLCDEYIEVFGSDSYKEFENDVHGERTVDLLSKILVYIDSSKEFRMANNIQQKTGISFDQNRLEDMAMKRSEIKMRRSKKAVTLRENLVADWKAWIKDSNKVFRNSDKGATYEKNNEYLKTKYYNNLNSDYYDSLSVDEKVSGLLDAILRWNFPTVAKWMQKNISLIIITAKRQHIQNAQRFHEILVCYCEIDMDQSEKSSEARVYISRACKLMAENPSVSEDLATRKRYCEIGMLNCDETFEENGVTKESTEYKDLKDLLNELNSAPVTKLDLLCKEHNPQLTVDFLCRQFEDSDKLKHLTHKDEASSDSRPYSLQLESMRIVFEQEAKNVNIPKQVKDGIRMFLNDSMQLDEYMYNGEDTDRLPIGWGTPEWQEWLRNHSSINNPLNDACDFPYKEDVKKFRLLYRIRRNEQLSKMIASIAPEINLKIKGRKGVHDYYGWLPMLASVVNQIVSDIHQDHSDVTIDAEINISEGTITIIHTNSEINESAESFYTKLTGGGGAIYGIAEMCKGLCDYHVIANWTDGLQKVSIVNMHGPAIERMKSSNDSQGFKHVLTLYTKSPINVNVKKQ